MKPRGDVFLTSILSIMKRREPNSFESAWRKASLRYEFDALREMVLSDPSSSLRTAEAIGLNLGTFAGFFVDFSLQTFAENQSMSVLCLIRFLRMPRRLLV